MTVTRLLKELRVAWKIFLLGIVLLVGSTVATQISPLAIQTIIDEVFVPVTRGAALNTGYMLSLIGLCLALVTGGSILGYFATRLLMRAANKTAENIRNQAYDTMQRLPIAYFDDKPAGKISSRIVNDTETLRSHFYGSLLSQIVIHIIWITTIYIILLFLNVWLGLGLLLLIPLFYVWQKIYGKKTKQAMTTFYEAQSEVNSQVNEAMSGSTIIQVFGQEEAVEQEFLNTIDRMYQADMYSINIEASLSWSLMTLLHHMVVAFILAFIGYQFIGGQLGISAGLIFSYVNYTMRLFDSMGALVRQLPPMQRSLATGQRVLELLDEPIETDSCERMEASDGVVEFDHVWFAYRDENWVLKDIHFRANQGETVALVGHTGSGKSSIMNVLFRFYDPQKGAILIDGQPIQQFNRESVRAEMGIVLQDPYLFTGTIASNVAMDDDTMTDATITDALIKVGAKPMLDRLEKGIKTPVVEKGNAFSSGERQLIAFARTLASNPKILILDEATSHIDTETEEVIQNAMNVVKQGRTTFIIAHRLSTIQNADQILVLHEGEIVERGTHQQLLAQNGRYAEMHRMQQKI